MALKKIDFYNGCPYQTNEGFFYYVADVEPILNKIAALETILCNVNGEELADKKIIADVCAEMRQLKEMPK